MCDVCLHGGLGLLDGMLIALRAAATAAVEERSEATVNERELDDSHHFKDVHTVYTSHKRARRRHTHTRRQVLQDVLWFHRAYFFHRVSLSHMHTLKHTYMQFAAQGHSDFESDANSAARGGKKVHIPSANCLEGQGRPRNFLWWPFLSDY